MKFFMTDSAFLVPGGRKRKDTMSYVDSFVILG